MIPIIAGIVYAFGFCWGVPHAKKSLEEQSSVPLDAGDMVFAVALALLFWWYMAITKGLQKIRGKSTY